MAMLPATAFAQVDYSVVYVNEESGTEFTCVTSENDYVCMPQVRRNGARVSWLTNRIIDVSVDGTQLAYLSYRNNTSNIFIKDIGRQGSSVQRTNRQAVLDFSYSPDGKNICFSEKSGKFNAVSPRRDALYEHDITLRHDGLSAMHTSVTSGYNTPNADAPLPYLQGWNSNLRDLST